MSKGKKTINVSEVLAICNTILARDEKDVPDIQKRMVCTVIEAVLHGTGNYHGYNQLDWCKNGGFEAWQAAGSKFGEQSKYTGREYTRVYF